MSIDFSPKSHQPTLHSDHFGSLNRVQRRKNIRWHQKHPNKPVTFEPQKCLPSPSGIYTFEQVTPFHVECDDTPVFTPQSNGINFVKAVFLVLAMSSALPIACSNPQNATENEQSIVRVRRGIPPLFLRFPMRMPMRFPRIPVRAPKFPSRTIPKPRITAKKPPSKSIPKAKGSKRTGGSKTQNRDRSGNSDFKVDKQKRKLMQQQATCAAKMVAITQAANGLKELVSEGREFIYTMRNESLTTFSLYAEQVVSLANQTQALGLNFTESAEENFFNLQARIDKVWNDTVVFALEMKNHTSAEIDRARNYILFGALTKEAMLVGLSTLIPLIQIICTQRNNRQIKKLMKEVKLLQKQLNRIENNGSIPKETTPLMLTESSDSQV